jgi:hypothetical protein
VCPKAGKILNCHKAAAMGKAKQTAKMAWKAWTYICVAVFSLFAVLFVGMAAEPLFDPFAEERDRCFELQGTWDHINNVCLEYEYDMPLNRCLNLDGDRIYGKGCRLEMLKFHFFLYRRIYHGP